MYRVYRAHYSSGALGKIAHLALLGVGILFVGPIALGIVATLLGVVVAVLGAALPFVLIGAIGYGPYLLVKRMFGRQAPPIVPEARRVFPEPPRVQPAVFELPLEPYVQTRPERRPRGVVARVIGEVLSGAVVGAILGAVTVVGPVGEWQVSTLMNYCALGAGIGAVVGFVVGGPRPAPAEKTPARSAIL